MTNDTSWLGEMPEFYDRCLVPALFRPHAVEMAARAAALAPRRVLELAAGTGAATAELVVALPAAEILATDLNPAMVAWGSAHVDGVEWAIADAQDLQLEADSFELAVCQFGMMFLPDRPAAFGQLARVLSPGGTVLFSVWDDIATSPFPAALVASLAVVLPQDPPTFVVRVPHGYTDPATIRSDVEAGGLQLQSLEKLVLRGRAPSARALADGFCRGTPLRFALEARGSLDALTRAVGDEMTVRLGEGDVTGDLGALVVAARKPSS
jgi:SAM-dependent methyltransferase